MHNIPKSHILEMPFTSINTVLGQDFIPISTSTALLNHEITAFFGAINQEIGRSIVENTQGFQIGIYYSHNVCVTFDGCLFKNNSLIAADSLNFREESRPVLAHFLENQITEAAIEDPCILLYGPGWTTWGHWTIEFFTRIYLLERMGTDLNTVKWILPTHYPKFVDYFLNLFGIQESSLLKFDHTKQYLRCKSLIIPTNLTCGMSCHPLMSDYIKWLRHKLNLPLNPNINERIYLSRQNLGSSRHIINAQEVEEIMTEYGYKIIYPETLGVASQIELYSKSTSIFSEYGSASHNSIFAPASTFIGCLRDNKRSVGFIQSALCKAANQKMCYVFGREEAQHSPLAYYINPDDLHDSLKFSEKMIKCGIKTIFDR